MSHVILTDFVCLHLYRTNRSSSWIKYRCNLHSVSKHFGFGIHFICRWNMKRLKCHREISSDKSTDPVKYRVYSSQIRPTLIDVYTGTNHSSYLRIPFKRRDLHPGNFFPRIGTLWKNTSVPYISRTKIEEINLQVDNQSLYFRYIPHNMHNLRPDFEFIQTHSVTH